MAKFDANEKLNDANGEGEPYKSTNLLHYFPGRLKEGLSAKE